MQNITLVITKAFGMKKLISAMTFFAATAMAGPAEDAVRAGLSVLDQRVGIESVEAIGAGLYQVNLVNGDQLYSVENGAYLLTGDLYQVDGPNLVNLTEESRNADRLAALEALDPSGVLVFGPPKDQVKAVIHVFTDIDCGYCRKLHDEIDQYTELGIEIRYLAFPRAGVGSASYDTYVSAYCNAEPLQALTDAKAGRAVPAATCDNPIASQFQLGQQMGVNGTPSMVMDNGQMIPGYVPAPQLAAQLGL